LRSDNENAFSFHSTFLISAKLTLAYITFGRARRGIDLIYLYYPAFLDNQYTCCEELSYIMLRYYCEVSIILWNNVIRILFH